MLCNKVLHQLLMSHYKPFQNLPFSDITGGSDLPVQSTALPHWADDRPSLLIGTVQWADDRPAHPWFNPSRELFSVNHCFILTSQYPL